MIKYFSIIIFGITFSPRSFSEIFKTECANGISISADVVNEVKDFHFWENLEFFKKSPHILGNLKLVNGSDKATLFSMSYLKLSSDAFQNQRAYLKSIASHIIDSKGVIFQINESKDFVIYWPVPLEIGTTATNLRLVCVEQ